MKHKVVPLITQMRPAYFSVDCGMAYIIRVCDGRFVLIDSCYGEYEEIDHLWEILGSQNEIGDRPVIAAWFFTHAHPKHFRGFTAFMGKYGAQVRLEQDSCFLKTTAADSYTVCQFVQPGQMAGTKNAALTFSGRLEPGSEGFGLFWNYAMPTVFSEEAVLWLKARADGNFSFCLLADAQKEKVQLYLYDECVFEMTYQKCCGLYFILKNASVRLDHIRCEEI